MFDACCLKSIPSLPRRSSSAPGCMDILASAVRMICCVVGEDVLKCSKSSLAYPNGGSDAPSLWPNSPRKYAASRTNFSSYEFCLSFSSATLAACTCSSGASVTT